MVTVLVGPKKSKFAVHQDFLTYHSPYFAGCLEGSFKEAATKVVEIEHTTPEPFAFFVQWIYTKDITPLPEDVSQYLILLVDLGVLADYLQVPAL